MTIFNNTSADIKTKSADVYIENGFEYLLMITIQKIKGSLKKLIL